MFLRGDGICAGTSTAGTGTLTLAACPSIVGLADPIAATIFGTSGTYPCNAVIIEYTSATFVTVLQMEIGQNQAMTLASAVTATTLTRAPVATFSGGAWNNSSPSPISIGTAANVLVFFSATSLDFVPTLNAVSTSGITNADGLGMAPLQGALATGNNITLASGTVNFQRVKTERSFSHSKASLALSVAITTPTTNSLAMALFEINASGLPGKRILTYATQTGTSTTVLGGTGIVTCTAGATAFLPAGYYILGVLPVWTGGTGSPSVRAATSVAPSPFGTRLTSAPGPIGYCTVASGNLSDPPSTTSITAAPAVTECALALG